MATSKAVLENLQKWKKTDHDEVLILKVTRALACNNPSYLENLGVKNSAEAWAQVGNKLVLPVKKREMFWLTGLKVHGNDAFYLESISYFYFSIQRFDRALQYLRKAVKRQTSVSALILGMVCATELLQYHLTWDYYQLIEPGRRNVLNVRLKQFAARAALELENYQEADEILKQILSARNGKELRTLESIVVSSFKNKAQKIKWTEQTTDMIRKSKRIPIQDVVKCATVLMHREDYQVALEIALLAKKQRCADVLYCQGNLIEKF